MFSNSATWNIFSQISWSHHQAKQLRKMHFGQGNQGLNWMVKTRFNLNINLSRQKLPMEWGFSRLLFSSIFGSKQLGSLQETLGLIPARPLIMLWTNANEFAILHPWKQTWNLKMDPWKRRFLLETIISRFHVNFWGCTTRQIIREWHLLDRTQDMTCLCQNFFKKVKVSRFYPLKFQSQLWSPLSQKTAKYHRCLLDLFMFFNLFCHYCSPSGQSFSCLIS